MEHTLGYYSIGGILLSFFLTLSSLLRVFFLFHFPTPILLLFSVHFASLLPCHCCAFSPKRPGLPEAAAPILLAGLAWFLTAELLLF